MFGITVRFVSSLSNQIFWKLLCWTVVVLLISNKYLKGCFVELSCSFSIKYFNGCFVELSSFFFPIKYFINCFVTCRHVSHIISPKSYFWKKKKISSTNVIKTIWICFPVLLIFQCGPMGVAKYHFPSLGAAFKLILERGTSHLTEPHTHHSRTYATVRCNLRFADKRITTTHTECSPSCSRVWSVSLQEYYHSALKNHVMYISRPPPPTPPPSVSWNLITSAK